MVRFYLDPRLVLLLATLLLSVGSVALWVMLGRSWKGVAKTASLALLWLACTAAIIQSGASADLWTIDATSKAGRVSLYNTAGTFIGDTTTPFFVKVQSGAAANVLTVDATSLAARATLYNTAGTTLGDTTTPLVFKQQSGASSDQQTIDATSKAGRVSLYSSAGVEIPGVGQLQTFGISSTFTPAATPTDLVIIEGSSTKTIRMVSMNICTTNTAAGSQEFFLIKRSAADTTGTFVSAGTPVPLDSNDAASTVNRVGHFTANPGALGTAVGTIARYRVASTVAIPATFAGIREITCQDMMPWYSQAHADQRITLRGVAQTLAINFNGVALVAGQTHTYTIVWTEE